MTLVRRVLALDAPSQLEEELALQRPGWAVMQARPDSRAGQVLFADVLDALGKRSMSSYRGRAANHSESIAFAWLAAGPTEHLVVRGSHLLTPKNVRRLCTLTTACRVKTWLVDELHVNDGRASTRDGLLPSESEVGDLVAQRSRSGVLEPAIPLQRSAAVPDVHFLNFLTTAEELMSPDDFEALLPHYRHALITTRDWLTAVDDATEEEFARHLHALGADTTDLNALTVLARGAQAGAFVAGWHARVDVNRFAHRGAGQELEVVLRPEDWRAIESLLRPSDAATCVLAALGVAVDEIPEITKSEVSNCGSLVTARGRTREVPARAQHLLVAQHVHRDLMHPEAVQFLAAGSKDPLVNSNRVGALLHAVTRDTGVILRARNSSRSVSDRSRWTHRLGVSLTPLTA